MVYGCLLMLVTPYMCNTLYLAQKSPKLKLTVFLSNFHLSAKKPVNVFSEGAISLKTTNITKYLDI